MTNKTEDDGKMSVSWKAYVDARFDAVEKATNIALVSAKAAVDSALVEKDKSVTSAFAASEKAIQKSEESQRDYNRTIVELQKDIVSLKESRSQSGGKDAAHTSDTQIHTASRQEIWGYIAGVSGIVIAILTFVAMHH
jgi:septal ring factor EnvC (AmiA/AmiB activator)